MRKKSKGSNETHIGLSPNEAAVQMHVLPLVSYSMPSTAGFPVSNFKPCPSALMRLQVSALHWSLANLMNPTSSAIGETADFWKTHKTLKYWGINPWNCGRHSTGRVREKSKQTAGQHSRFLSHHLKCSILMGQAYARHHLCQTHHIRRLRRVLTRWLALTVKSWPPRQEAVLEVFGLGQWPSQADGQSAQAPC